GSNMVDLRALVTKVEGIKRLARWFLRLRILPQFLFAEGLLYGDSQGSEGNRLLMPDTLLLAAGETADRVKTGLRRGGLCPGEGFPRMYYSFEAPHGREGLDGGKNIIIIIIII